ncbi:hypothetical protein DC083_07920 [Ignatzschineria ureiclastica]|uniref:Uracil-DNA glycosylase-like domain-containing protein n=2 Tax=Ignatzschineria ureiclastica TaxID=472582 RepID=A0A2U2AED1_9GAMM|nr:hypothetical protein DC083_07920 [Ignatzschineria ureiclastica]
MGMDTRQATYLKLLGIQAWCKQEDLPRIREYQKAQAGQSVSVASVSGTSVKEQSAIVDQSTLIPPQADYSSNNVMNSAETATSQRKQGFFSDQLSSIIDGEKGQPRRQVINEAETNDQGTTTRTLESNVHNIPQNHQSAKAFKAEPFEATSFQGKSSDTKSFEAKPFESKPFSSNKATSIFTSDFLQSIRQCTACEFSQSRQQATLPRQNHNAKVMVITDIPLKEEMYQGVVLDRQDESFFFKALSAVGLPPESLYITPFIKCRPPELRDVTAQEWQACVPILQQEIIGLNPDFLFILGRTSVKFLLGQELPFDQLRGEIHQVNMAGQQFPAIISHSPKVYAHNARLKANFWKDVKLLRRSLAD